MDVPLCVLGAAQRYIHGVGCGRVRTSLGEEQFKRAYTQGEALRLDQALDLALGRTRSV